MLEPRLVVNQCYILQERLGADTFSELWRASSIYSATQFLLRFVKELPGAEARMPAFKVLARDCYSIQAPSVMDFVEVESWGDRTFIASEWDEQRNLLDSFGATQRLRLEYACRFIMELGQGLDTFHKRGITYRCLNAENVLVTRVFDRFETIRVQKPGYAPFLDLVDSQDPVRVLENFGYMAPEAKNGGPVDPRADLYSLGVHLFRFIVGRLPYARATRARSGSVSPGYVARAFVRRGVPAPITKVAVRAMRRNPRLRYGEVLELIADLRAFLDERRRELLARGEVDPMADLVLLNRGRDRLDATQAMRSLETADYFRSISMAEVGRHDEAPALLFPVDDFTSPAEVETLEAEEAEGEDDDDRLSPEDYVDGAYERVSRESASARRGGTPVPPPAPPRPRPQAPSAPTHEEFGTFTLATPFGPTTGAPVLRKAVPSPLVDSGLAEAASPKPVLVGAFASDPGPAPRSKLPPQERVDAGGVSWRPDLASPAAVVAGMESAFTRSFKGTGAFRFIQEPPPGPDALPFARVFARFRAKGLLVDLGTLPKGADVTDLLRALRKGLAESLGYESPQSRAVLARRLRALDEVGAFRAEPLGELLYGENGAEPDPEWMETTEAAMRLGLCLASLGRRRKPFILSFRGGEALGQGAHGALMELARLAPIASFCCFAFYKPSVVPAWHVLSTLNP